MSDKVLWVNVSTSTDGPTHYKYDSRVSFFSSPVPPSPAAGEVLSLLYFGWFVSLLLSSTLLKGVNKREMVL